MGKVGAIKNPPTTIYTFLVFSIVQNVHSYFNEKQSLVLKCKFIALLQETTFKTSKQHSEGEKSV